MADTDELDELRSIRDAMIEAVGVLRGIEGILDQLTTVAEDIERSNGIVAYRSLPWWQRIKMEWRHAGEVIKQTTDEAKLRT